MMKYYGISFDEECEDNPTGCGTGIGTVDENYKKIAKMIHRNQGTMLDIEVEQIKVKLDNNVFGDFFSTNIMNIYSEKLQQIIEKHKSPNDYIEWFEVNVYNDEESRKYYALHFTKLFDLIDYDKSYCYNDVVIIPTYRKELVKEHNIFLKSKYSDFPIVCQTIKDEIEKNNLIGMSFNEVKIK